MNILQQVLKRSLPSNMTKGLIYRKGLTLNPALKRVSTDTWDAPVQTMAETKAKLHKILGAHKGFHKRTDDRSHLLKLLPATQEELPPRTMKDSFNRTIIPLSTDLDLQDKYSTIQGFVRRGRLLEDMDIFAVWCSFKHIHNPKETPGGVSPYNVVTALVDQMAFTQIVPEPDADIRLSGHVSWVGQSSLEVTVWLEQQQKNEWKNLTRSIFLLVARNSTNTGPAFVNKLVATTPEEEDIIKGGYERKEYRTKIQEANLLKMVPDATEQKTIHKLFKDTLKKEDKTYECRELPPNCSWMSNTKLQSFISSHPQNRNLHNTVFGGFLMRQAMELSWNCAFLHGRGRPRLVYIGDIIFHRPVEVGSLIRMISKVVYTKGNYSQIATYAEVQDMHTHKIETTNEFHFTYRMQNTVRPVYPETYNEAMMYVNGRRHFVQAMGLSFPETRS